MMGQRHSVNGGAVLMGGNISIHLIYGAFKIPGELRRKNMIFFDSRRIKEKNMSISIENKVDQSYK
jgi:hypothetical protein